MKPAQETPGARESRCAAPGREHWCRCVEDQVGGCYGVRRRGTTRRQVVSLKDTKRESVTKTAPRDQPQALWSVHERIA